MKNSQLQLRVSHEQKEAIRQAADKASMAMSEWILNKIFPSSRSKFIEILSKLTSLKNQEDRRYLLNDLNEFLTGLSRDELKSIIAHEPGIKLNDFLENYTAAMVEHACMKKNLDLPWWLAKIDILKEPYFGSDLFSVRLYLLSSSPPAFRRRNIFIDATIQDRV